MPFVDTNDDVFLGEKSFAMWHEALDRYETLPYTGILLDKEYLANDTAGGFVQRMRAAFHSSDGDVLLHHQLRFLFPKS